MVVWHSIYTFGEHLISPIVGEIFPQCGNVVPERTHTHTHLRLDRATNGHQQTESMLTCLCVHNCSCWAQSSCFPILLLLLLLLVVVIVCVERRTRAEGETECKTNRYLCKAHDHPIEDRIYNPRAKESICMWHDLYQFPDIVITRDT